jgi:SAM-dependent methyltransferase
MVDARRRGGVSLAAVSYSKFAAVVLPLALLGVVVLGGLYVRGHRGRRAPAPTPAPARPPASERVAAVDAIYANATWGRNAEGVGYSGHGSTLASTTVYRAFLQAFLAENDIHSVVDAGCGDWESTRAIDWTGIDYKGYDIVDSIIAADRQKFAKPNIQFFVADIVNTDLPPADLLIAKHVLQHLPNADIQKLLRQMPKYKHVLFTNGVNALTLTAENVDVQAGGFRTLDLLRAPFNLLGLKVLTYWDGRDMHQVVHALPRVNPDRG